MKVILFWLCALLGGTAAAQSIDYKGSPLGTSLTDFRAAHPEFRCSRTEAAKTTCSAVTLKCPADRPACQPRTELLLTYGGAPVWSVAVTFLADALSAIDIEIPPKTFDPIVRALSDKYGQPKTSAETVRNLAGFSDANS